MFRIGVVGIGDFGRLIAETLSKIEGVALVALCNRTMEKAETFAGKLGVKHVFNNIDSMLAAGMVDAVCIATKTATHVPFAIKALEAGVDVFIEKPAGTCKDEIIRLRDVAEKTKKTVMIGHICLFHSLVNPAVKKIQGSGFKAIHFTRHRSIDVNHKIPDEHPISMVMVHDLYVAAQMAGGEEPVFFDAWDVDGENGPQFSWGTLRWKDGRVATFHAHNAIPESQTDGFDWFEAFCPECYMRINTNPQPAMVFEEKIKFPVPYEISEVNGVPVGYLVEELRAFIRACKGKATVPDGCRIEDAIQIQQWLDILMKLAVEKRNNFKNEEVK